MSLSHLSATDPQIADAINQELGRQRSSIELIASENFTIFYDSDFIPCSQETAVWQLSGTWNLNGQLLDVQLDVTKLTSGVEADVFYQLPVRHHLQRRNGS